MSKKIVGICAECDGEKPVYRNREDSKLLCANCQRKRSRADYKPPMRQCSDCGRLCTPATGGLEPLCKTCYKKIEPKHICSKCGRLAPVTTTMPDPLCNRCYKRPVAICSKCGKSRIIATRDPVLCHRCYYGERYKNDRIYRTRVLLRHAFRQAFQRFSKNGKTKPSKAYGIDYEAIITFLGACPGDREDYHIDHILPLSAFDFDNSIHVRAAFDPSNHRWMVGTDNLKKNDKFNPAELEQYLAKFL